MKAKSNWQSLACLATTLYKLKKIEWGTSLSEICKKSFIGDKNAIEYVLNDLIIKIKYELYLNLTEVYC